MSGVFVFEVREKADDGRTGAELGETGEENGGVNQHAGESDLLLCQIGGDNKKRGDEADDDSHVIDYSASDTLFYDNTHNGLCNVHPMEKSRNFYPK